jgi:GT2 family glycosyltransferase
MNKPLVSVVILNYNRKEVLRKCLHSALQLDYPALEWIVIDNASTDGSAEMVSTEFGEQVLLVRREVNSVTAARNQGFALARGEYILSLDNDILLSDQEVISKALALLATYPQVGLLSFKVGSPEHPDQFLSEHWWHPVPLQKGNNRFFYTHYFPEAAAFFRKEAIQKTGGYDETFFMGIEQGDLALKLLRAGFLILYCPTLVCTEMEARGSLMGRKSQIHYLNMRNKIWIAWKHYPLLKGCFFVLTRIITTALRAFRYGWVGYFLRGVWDGVCAPDAIRSQRKPLPAETWAVLHKIQKGWFVEEGESAGK